MRRLWIKIALLLLSLCFSVSLAAQTPMFNMPRGVTPISHDIYDLHMTIFWICVVIGVMVFSLLIYAMAKHRKSLGHKPAKFSHNIHVELVWIIVPTLILIGMAIPSTLVLIRMHDDAKADINIKITGYQWKWKYDYLDQGISFFSNLSTPQDQLDGDAKKNKWYLLQVDNPLVLPIHKKIRFLVTSNDVIHSWWVPDLGIKRDAIPGFIYEAWARIDKPGTYRGQCAELCGMRHGYMPIVIIAKTEKDFNQWVAEKTGKTLGPESEPGPESKPGVKITGSTKKTAAKPKATKMTLAQLMSAGKTAYTKTCAVCHKPDGSGMPPAFPAIKGGKISTGPIGPHIKIVLNGKAGSAMQAFKEQLSAAELAAVITYERNSWGNNDKKKYGKAAGGIVQPADINKLLKK